MSVRKNFNIELSRNRRMETDAKMRNQNETEWINDAISHKLACKEMRINQRWTLIFTSEETICLKCGKTNPKETQVMYSGLRGGVLCPECYLQRWGEKGRIANIMREHETMENIRVLKLEEEELIEKVVFLIHKDKLDQVLNSEIETEKFANTLEKKAEKVFKDFDDYVKRGYANPEEKALHDQLKNELNMLKEDENKLKDMIEVIKPIVRDLQVFDERDFLERLKKKKRLDVPAE